MSKRSEQGLRSLRLRGLKSRGQPDVCLRRATKDDGFEYYEMLFVYVDDIRTVITAQITTDSNKERSVKPPDIYSARLFHKWNSMRIETIDESLMTLAPRF